MIQSSFMHYEEGDKGLFVKLILFFFSPFLSFLYSLINPASRSSYVIYFLFGVVFCWHMDSRNPEHYDDFIGIMERFIEAPSYTSSEVWHMFLKSITFASDAPKDYFEVFLTSFTKWISNNYHLFFAFASIFYLTFMLSSLKKITDDNKFISGFWGLLIMALFVMPRDLVTVQNPRYTCGLWYNVMCTLNFYLLYSKKRWLFAFMIVLSPLFHSAMWPYVFIFFFCMIVSQVIKADKFYIFLFYISIPFSFLSYEILSQFDFQAFSLPSSIQKSIDTYFSDEAYARFIKNEGRSGFWWIRAVFDWLTIIAYSLIPYYMVKYRDEVFNDRRMMHFFNHFLLFSAIVNFLQSIPELGNRYYHFFKIFSIFMWLRFVFPRHKNILLFILFSVSFVTMHRYFLDGGAVSVCVPSGIWWKPLLWLIIDGL